MLTNYLTTALRGIWKYKAYSAINIFGLAIGIAASLLILMYVRYELSFDRYHEYLDRIYRINLHGSMMGQEVSASASPYPMAAALVNEFPEVESAARVRPLFAEPMVQFGELQYQESRTFHADPSFFDIFSFALLEGDRATALVEPNSIVITESIASKYFPGGGAFGQMLRFNNDRDYRITGIMEDVPANSHFHPEILLSFTSDESHDSQRWVSNNIQTYLLVRPGTDPANLEENLQTLVAKYVAPQIEMGIGITYDEFIAGGGRWVYSMTPLQDIHLDASIDGQIEPPGSAAYVYTFQAIAVFILLLACINFMNLSTARSANRAREIGVRKAMGAYQGQLVVQFLLESTLIAFIALLIALPLVAALLPSLNAITDRQMEIGFLLNPISLFYLLGFTVIVGTVSGSYPALFLSRFHPQEVLKGALSSGSKNAWLRGGLVVFQFAISISLISSTLIVFDQLDYMQNKPLGFNKEQVLVIDRASALGEQMDSFKTQIKQLPGVVNASSSQHMPGDQGDVNAFIVAGRPQAEAYALSRFTVDYDYVETLGIQLKQGRSFSRDFTGEHPGFLLNEAAVIELGLDDPLSAAMVEPGGNGEAVELNSGPVIGVINDFHFQSLHQEIEPMIMRIGSFERFVVARLQADDLQGTVQAIAQTWRDMTGGQPFQYSFLDEDFAALHERDQKMGEIFIGFSLLAIVIACLGLYGLASYTTEQRSKEIGVRKTLGASASDIVFLVAKDFMQLVAIALLISVPLAYLMMNEWLQLFAYRIDIGFGAFVFSGVLAIVLAFITVSYQSTIAANTNPSLTLRDE